MHQVCQMQTLQTWCTLDSACHWLLGVVNGPAHGPLADVVEPAAGTRPPVLVAFEAIVIIFTTMQRMSHPVRRLSPTPDIALESISQTTLGLLASRPVKAPGSNQHGSVPFTPCRSCKNQSTVKKFPTNPLAHTWCMTTEKCCICTHK